MKSLSLLFTLFIFFSCASKPRKELPIVFENDPSLKYQNKICTTLGNGENFNKEYITFGYDGNYIKAPIEKLRKKYGKKVINENNYPFSYSSSDYLSGYFKIESYCSNSVSSIIIEDTELLLDIDDLGKMGSRIFEYYLIITVSIEDKKNQKYTAIVSTPKHNMFTSSKNFMQHKLEAKKAAFKQIFRQIDDELQRLDKK